MDIHKIPVLEELVDGHGGQTSHPEYGLEGIGPGPQMGNGPQKLHGVPLGLEGVISSGGALHVNGLRLDLKGLLPIIRGQHQGALDNQGGADVDFCDLLEICHGVVINHLNRGKVSTVVQDDKAELLAAPAVSYPAAYGDFPAGIRLGVLIQLTNGNQIHIHVLFSC